MYVARESDKILAEAVQRYARGDCADAYDIITSATVEDPVNPRLPLAMYKLLQQLVVMMERDNNFDDKYAQKAMLKVLTLLGPDRALADQFKPTLKRYAH